MKYSDRFEILKQKRSKFADNTNNSNEAFNDHNYTETGQLKDNFTALEIRERTLKLRNC